MFAGYLLTQHAQCIKQRNKNLHDMYKMYNALYTLLAENDTHTQDDFIPLSYIIVFPFLHVPNSPPILLFSPSLLLSFPPFTSPVSPQLWSNCIVIIILLL